MHLLLPEVLFQFLVWKICSNSSDSSICCISNKRSKLNLDSTFLWHCRLGHINKKCIKKLQHDELLKSTNDESFDKCISGMSGKMEFLDHLKECGIVSQRTPPYTSQHNGVSERRNQTLLDMVRSMMSQTTLPKCFWDYALELVARILNIVPTKKVEKTLYEVWHGQAPKLSYLKEIMGYSFYHPPENKIIVAQNAEFYEDSLISQEAKEHDLEDHNEPTNYKATLLDPESNKWLEAMKVKTFSLVEDTRVIRILIAIAAYYDNEIWQMDVKTFFLNGHLTKEVYMVQPEGFVNPKYPERVCKLQRSIYGLKQASRHWNKRFDKEIKMFGFT
ncbi:retrotransposon protein, putative, ty1-copia subclass [Tanacetum coccineum]